MRRLVKVESIILLTFLSAQHFRNLFIERSVDSKLDRHEAVF